jgi:hypothetical protein
VAGRVDKSPQWTRGCLNSLGIEPEVRCGIRGRVRLHYPPSAVRAVKKELADNPPAEDWLTVLQIADLLRRESGVIRENLQSFKGEDRLGSSGRVALHYPPSVLETLRQRFATAKKAEGWLSIFELTQQLKRSRPWVREKLASLGIEPEMRELASRHALAPHYPPESVEKLRTLLPTQPLANGWLTVGGMGDTLGKDARWVKRMVEERGYRSEVRLDSFNRPFPHYPPSVLKALQKLRD